MNTLGKVIDDAMDTEECLKSRGKITRVLGVDSDNSPDCILEELKEYIAEVGLFVTLGF